MPETIPSNIQNHADLSPARPGIEDWSSLKDQNVAVYIGGRKADQGRVDDVMPDGSILWLMNDGSSGRRMIENQPGTSIQLSPR